MVNQPSVFEPLKFYDMCSFKILQFNKKFYCMCSFKLLQFNVNGLSAQINFAIQDIPWL